MKIPWKSWEFNAIIYVRTHTSADVVTMFVLLCCSAIRTGSAISYTLTLTLKTRKQNERMFMLSDQTKWGFYDIPTSFSFAKLT